MTAKTIALFFSRSPSFSLIPTRLRGTTCRSVRIIDGGTPMPFAQQPLLETIRLSEIDDLEYGPAFGDGTKRKLTDLASPRPARVVTHTTDECGRRARRLVDEGTDLNLTTAGIGYARCS